MTTIESEYEEFTTACGEAGEKVFKYAVVRANLNMLREGAYELEDREISGLFDALIDLISSKFDVLMKTEVQVDKTVLQVAVEDVDKLRYALEHVQLTGDEDVDDVLCALCDRLG